MGKLRYIKHTIRTVIILILVSYFGIIAFLNIPFVQKQLSAYAAHELEELFQTEVSIGSIDLGLLNRIIIQNVSLKDRNHDNLLKISRFSAKFDLASLFHGRIRINSVQLFGMNACLKKETPESKPNFQFIIDAFAPKDTVKKENKIDLRINTVLIRRGQLKYDVLSLPETPEKFNANHINISNLSATLSLKALQTDSLNAQIRRMSFDEQSGFQLKKLAAKLTANKDKIEVSQFSINLPATELILDTLSVTSPQAEALFAFNEQTRYVGKLHASVVLADLSPFVPTLKHFNDPLLFKFTFQGKAKQAECTELSLSGFNEQLTVQAKGTVDANNTPYFTGKVTNVHVSETGIARLFQNISGKEKTPAILKQIGSIGFNGNISGYPHRITTHGALKSGVGNIEANITMHTDTITQLHSYSGFVKSKEIKLGKLLNKENTFGKTAFDVELKGLKYRNNKPESYVKGVISSLEYNRYEYKNIALDGQYTPGGFKGRLALDDENGKVDINGEFVTQQQTPDFNLHATVRNFRPHSLRLTDKHEDKTFALNLTADFSGNSIDNVKGTVNLDSLTITLPNDSTYYHLPNLNISSKNIEGKKTINIHSPFLQGDITGIYTYRNLLTSVKQLIHNYIPSLVPGSDTETKTENRFDFALRIENSDIAHKVFGIPFQLEMPATLNGSFNDSTMQMKVNGYLPKFNYKGKLYESGVLLCENTNKKLTCQLRANTLMKKGSMLNFSLLAQAQNDSLQTTVYWGNNTNVTYSGKVNAIASFVRSEKEKPLHTRIDIQPSNVILNDTVWHVHPATISIDKDSIDIRDFLFEHKDQHLKINGCIGKNITDSCLVDLRNINLLYVMDIIQFHAVKFYGLVSGKVHLQHVMKDPLILADLKVKDFSLNDALLGQADITGSWDNELGGIRLDADIQENKNYFTQVKGYVSPKQKGLDLHIRAGGTTFAFLQPFVKNIFSDIKGRIFGNVRLFGPFSQLDLEGVVQANVGMKVNILNTRFEASADSVHITPGNFNFHNVRLTDPEGNTGIANGYLRHTKLKNLSYRFQFDTNNLLVYNTARETPDFPFYGQIYTTGNVQLRGGDNTLNVDGTLQANNNTTFSYVLGTAAEATDNQFITFVDRTPRRQQEEIKTELYHYLNRPTKDNDDDTPADIRINLQIEPTEQANMKIIMDPEAGDNISAKGTGNLRINFFNKGDFQIFGDYNITEGIYKMSMQNIIHKDFTLQSGGTVTFNGNPRAANLNVQAVYTVNSASLNDLIADASSSQGNIRVNCLLNLTGNLTAPNLSFDLELPTVSEEDRELVRSLTSTEEQMNTQIIYLLGVGKFYTYDYANNNNSQSNATSSLAFSTLSGQLNNMLSQVIDNQNWNVGTNLTTGEKGWSDVEAEAILSGRLLNNRLIINGNFGYRENTMRNTNFVGDFEAIWLLTKNGEFRLRGYNQTNDRYFTKSTLTTQGIGFMYKKDFTNWKELISRFLRHRRLRSSNEKEKEEQKNNLKEANLPTAQEKRQRK